MSDLIFPTRPRVLSVFGREGHVVLTGDDLVDVLVAGANITITPVGDTLEISASGGGGGGGLTWEQIQDLLSAAIVPGYDVEIEYDDVANTFAWHRYSRLTTDVDGPTITLDLDPAVGRLHDVTIDADRNLDVSNAVTGKHFDVRITQGAGGNHRVTLLFPCEWLEADGSQPQQTPVEGQSDLWHFYIESVDAYGVPRCRAWVETTERPVPLVTSAEANVTIAANVTTIQEATPGTNEVQQLTLYGSPTGGTFTLSFSGQTTSAIAFNASAGTVQTALIALSNLAPSDVTCGGGPFPGTPITVTFGGAYQFTNVPQITANAASLTGANLHSDVATTQGGGQSGTITWTGRTAANNLQWQSVVYGNGLFVAVAQSGTGNRVMTSPDGMTWTARTTADVLLSAVCFANGLFVAVGGGGSVMTSTDGITWVNRNGIDGVTSWRAIAYGAALFVAVGQDDVGKIMTSPNGITWTARSDPASNSAWYGVAFSGSLFAAVANQTVNNSERIITSPDGITWTLRTGHDRAWAGVCYGGGKFVAVAQGNFTVSTVMTSTDGVTWDLQNASNVASWLSITFGGGLFVAVGNDVMSSVDGITWSGGSPANSNEWSAVCYNSGLFVAVSNSGAGQYVMTSPGVVLSDEVQTITMTGTPTQGTVGVTFNGSTASFTHNETSSVAQTKLRTLASINGPNVNVTGGPWPGTPLVVAFVGSLAQIDVAEMTTSNSELWYSIATTTQGSPGGANEIQEITITPDAEGGTFTLSFAGNVTAPLSFDATILQIATALESLPIIDDVIVTGGPLATAAVQVEFAGSQAGTDVVLLVCDPDGLLSSTAEIFVARCDFPTITLAPGAGVYAIAFRELIDGKTLRVEVISNGATGSIDWDAGDAPVTWPGGQPDMPADGESLFQEFECKSATRIIGKRWAGSAVTVGTRSGVTIGTSYQPSLTRDVELTVSVQIATGAAGDGEVELLCDSANPPTTVRGTFRVGTALLTLCQQLRCVVPAGNYWRLVSTTLGGTPTYSVIGDAQEVAQ